MARATKTIVLHRDGARFGWFLIARNNEVTAKSEQTFDRRGKALRNAEMVLGDLTTYRVQDLTAGPVDYSRGAA